MLRSHKIISIGLFAAVCVSAGAQSTNPLQPPAPPPPPASQIAATVNGQPITELAVYRGLLGSDASKRESFRLEVLNFLIDNALIDQYLDGLKITIDAKELEAQFAKLKGELKGRTIEDLCKSLMLTEADLRTQLAATTRWDKFLAQYTSEKQLRDFFDANKALFDNSMVRARHILFPPLPAEAVKAEEAKSRIIACRRMILEDAARRLADAGKVSDADLPKKRFECLEAAFAKAATEQSFCDTKLLGGDLGMFPRSGGKVVEPFARAAFALKVGELSDPVVTEFGCHLILCTGSQPGKDVKYEEIRESVHDVFSDRMREAVLEKMRPTAKIQLNPMPR
jgi:peptidyl-prolyl cis-trans isomerase C